MPALIGCSTGRGRPGIAQAQPRDHARHGAGRSRTGAGAVGCDGRARRLVRLLGKILADQRLRRRLRRGCRLRQAAATDNLLPIRARLAGGRRCLRVSLPRLQRGLVLAETVHCPRPAAGCRRARRGRHGIWHDVGARLRTCRGELDAVRRRGQWSRLERDRLALAGEDEPALDLVTAGARECVMLIAGHRHGVVRHHLYQPHLFAARHAPHCHHQSRTLQPIMQRPRRAWVKGVPQGYSRSVAAMIQMPTGSGRHRRHHEAS